MDVIIVPTTDFYPILAQWSMAHKFPSENVVLDVQFLPRNVYVCMTGNVPVYSVFVYESEQIAWLAYPMSNPEVPYLNRKDGLTVLFKFIEKNLNNKGIKMLFTTSSTERVEKALWDCNYKEGDTKVNHYYKIIWEQQPQPEQLLAY